MEKMADMMERVGNTNSAVDMVETVKPSREQLEANVQISHNWRTAVASGQFQGAQALHIATLLDFLSKQNAEATKIWEAEFAAHPEWGRKPINEVPA